MIPANRKNIIEELGFNLVKFSLLEKYLELLWAANEELNLVSRQMTITDLIDNHVIDSLLPLKYFPSDAKKVADFRNKMPLKSVLKVLLNLKKISLCHEQKETIPTLMWRLHDALRCRQLTLI